VYSIVKPTLIILEDTGDLVFKTLALTSEYVASELMEAGVSGLIGKELRWRHVPPESSPTSFLGQVIDATYEDGKIWATARIFGRTKAQQLAQELVRNGDIDAVSVGFIKMTDNEGKPNEIFFRELSLTPKPKCKNCNISSINNEIGVESMSMKPNPAATPEDQAPKVGKSYISCPHCDSKFMTAEDLNEHLANVVLAQMNKIAILQKMEEKPLKQHPYVQKLEQLEEEHKNKLIEYEVYSERLEGKLKDMSTRVKEYEEKLTAKDTIIQRFETLPLRYHIAELMGFGNDLDAAKAVVKEYENNTKPELENIIIAMEAVHESYEIASEDSNAQISSEGFEESSIEHLEGDDLIRAFGIDPNTI